MRQALIIVLVALGSIALVASAVASPLPTGYAEEGKADAPAPKKVTDAEAKAAVEAFEVEYSRDDFDLPVLEAMNKVRAVTQLGKIDHKLAAKELLGHLKVKEDKVWIAIVEALGNMKQSARLVTSKLQRLYDPKKLSTPRLVAVIDSLGRLGAGKMSKDFVKLFMHEDDKVVVAAIVALGNIKDASVMPQLREMFEINSMDPSKGVSVRVDTGAAGSGDMNRARAAGKRMQQLRRKNGKAVSDALKASFVQLCGTKIETPEELKEWMRRNKKIWR